MKWLNSKIFAFTIGIICISISVLFAIYQSTKKSLIETNKQLLHYANDVMYRTDKTGQQIYDNITKLKADAKKNPCLINYIGIMRSLDISSSNIQAIGYVKNNILICSSLGVRYLNWNLGPVDLVTSNGALIRFSVKIPYSEDSFIVVEKNHYAVIIHKDILLETAFFNQDISLGVFALDNQHLFAKKGFIDPQWFQRLENKDQAVFLQDGYAVVLNKSKNYKIASVAAKPFAYLNQNMLKMALILVPMSALFGLVLTYVIIYWIRQQISPVAMLKAGIKRKAFYLVYQPIFDVRTNLCVGAEVLLRWKRTSSETIFPDEFIPLAEKTDLIRQLTDLVFELIAKEAKDLFKTYPHFHLAINVSAEDLHSTEIVENLRTLMLKTNAGPHNLMIEATERKIMNLDILKQTLHAIRSLGVKVAIDDFGTGYSNLSYLETLDLDYLKIDKSFVDAVGTDSSTSQVILHIIEMAKSLNLQIIAEGVESKEQAAFIREKGVQFAQGWFYGKPTSLKEVLALLKQR